MYARARYPCRVATAANFPVPTMQEANFTYIPIPWATRSCAWCEKDSDCRSATEYCDVNGCCQQGECTNDSDCEAFNSATNYYPMRGFDSFGSDSNSLHPQDDLELLESSCDVNNECVGYNSYGFLKHKIRAPEFWDPQPPIKWLPDWTLFLKKRAVDRRDPDVPLPHGIKTFCDLPDNAHAAKNKVADAYGRCRQCLACEEDQNCPPSTLCVNGCCVNNPCYSATPEDGEWVDGHYTRENQCNCPDGEEYCCMTNREDIHSARCSKTPCYEDEMIMACAYLCEDPDRKFDAVMCAANERCCNDSEGAPTCCPSGEDCDPKTKDNQCIKAEMKTCRGVTGYADIQCFASQTCCNSVDAAPVCCDSEKQCIEGETNSCHFAETVAS
jgi:hypothetical protein